MAIEDLEGNVGYITDNPEGLTPYQFSYNATLSGGYTPKNKKCYCYPYNYVSISNYYGGEKTLKYENFSNATQNQSFVLHLSQCVSQEPTYAVIPWDYEGIQKNYDMIVKYDNFPQLPWNYDAYANWFALNSNSIIFDYIKNAAGLVIGAATGNASVAASSAFSAISETVSLLDKAKQPEQTRGKIVGNLLIYTGKAGIFIRKMCAKTEYIAMIDKFFTQYGYNICEYKIPSYHNRRNFDYLKTANIDIIGDIPQEDIEELESIFDNGVTVWHIAASYGNYTVDNSPIT